MVYCRSKIIGMLTSFAPGQNGGRKTRKDVEKALVAHNPNQRVKFFGAGS